MLQIPDPVHGHITLDGMYAKIVNTPEFQRLRSIEQGSFRPVFPGARHDRFIHSLGTYHLAAKFADHFFRNLHDDLGIDVEESEKNLLKTTFCYAALLHDIGHAPFSHTTEDFFLEPKDPNDSTKRLIWTRLCDVIQQVSGKNNGKEAAREPDLFRNPRKECIKPPKKTWIGAAHEIMSSILLVSNWENFIPESERPNVDLALAARMVIGYTYSPEDPGTPTDDANAIRSLGIRNCLIQMLNSSILDVDRLDYLGRDTQMSGYFNAPLNLDCLAASVTAVKLPGSNPEKADDGWLAPAYRDVALSVFDLMFQAKLSHDVWVLASPAGPYEAGLLAHCIRKLNEKIHEDYMKKVFSEEALGYSGIILDGKRYRLLSDVDVSADLKAQSGGQDSDYDELYTRELGKRRIAAWRSYYEFHHIFNAPDIGVTPKAVYDYFKPLMGYMGDNHLFIFNAESYARITSESSDPEVKNAADFLRKFLMDHAPDAASRELYNVVLLDRTNNFTMKVDPAQIRITFPKRSIPLRADKKNYSTYAELTGVSVDDKRSSDYFYLYRHGGLGSKQLTDLRNELAKVL